MVNEYVTLYTKDQLQLVPQERPWGFTETAEVGFRTVSAWGMVLFCGSRRDVSTPAQVANERLALFWGRFYF